jgi:hypothetical protein
MRVMAAFGRESPERASKGGWIREFAGPDAVREKYGSIISRNGKLLCVFTSAARWYYNYKGQLKDCLDLDAGNRQVSEIYLPQAKHTYPLLEHREHLIDAICSWVRNEFSSQLVAQSVDAQAVHREYPDPEDR